MEEWIAGNKEWFLSGAGIFVVTCFFSSVTAIITFWLKSRSEGKKRKRLQLTEKLVRFELPAAQGEVDSSSLSVSFEGQQYKHLCHYTLFALNSGSIAIEGQNLLLSFPEDALIIKRVHRPGNSSIKLGVEQIVGSSETLYSIDRLEPGETLLITVLANLAGSSSISCTPRGVDNIDYPREKTESISDIETLVYFVAAFILAGALPIIGGMLQGIVVLISSPHLVRMAKEYMTNKKTDGKSVIINGGIRVSDAAAVNISQLTDIARAQQPQSETANN